MIQRYNRQSLTFGLSGIILYAANVILIILISLNTPSLFYVFDRLIPFSGIIGAGLVFVGCIFYAKAKGRNGLWALFIFLGIIGLIVLACLEDRSAPPGVEYCICCGKPYQLDNAPLKCPSCNVRLKIEADQRG